MADEEDIDDTIETEESAAGGDDQQDAGDEGLDENEAGGDGEEGEEGEESSSSEDGSTEAGASPAQASQSRRDKRIEALTKERNAERESRIRAETLAEERARQTSQPAANSQEQQRLREEKLALMTPEERREFVTDEKISSMQQQVLITQLQTKDMIDKAKYEGRASADPVWAKHAEEVERRLHASRRNGIDYSREDILKFVIGEQALKGKPTASAKRNAAERVNTSQSKPLPGKSNPSMSRRPAGGRESLEELERRIGDVSFPNDMRIV